MVTDHKYHDKLEKNVISVTAPSKARICSSLIAGIAGSIPAGGQMSVSYGCCVLSGRSLCDGPMSRPGSPTECGASECDLETSIRRRSRPTRAVKPCKKEKLREKLK